MKKQWMFVAAGSMLTAPAFANPAEQDEGPLRSTSVVPGSGIGAPRAGGMAAPASVNSRSNRKTVDVQDAQLASPLARHSPEPRLILAPSTRGAMTVPTRFSEDGTTLFSFDDHSTYQLTNYSNPPSSLLSIDGQVKPDGFDILADEWVGAATDAVMMSVPPGSPGGVPPQGNLLSTGLPPGQYVALARASGQDSLTTSFTVAMGREFDSRTMTPQQPLIVAEDWYLTSAKTSQWWGVVTLFEGPMTLDRVFFGGTNLGGDLIAFHNDEGILDRFVSTGVLAGNPMQLNFVSAPRDPALPFPVNQWFILSEILAVDNTGRLGQSLWIKTADSIANGFLDPRMASGDLTPADEDPAGWVNLHPGVEDDPRTSAREGVGLAETMFGVPASTSGHLGLAPVNGRTSLTSINYGEGLDPLNDQDFQPSDAFIDNTTFIGGSIARADLAPDHVVPFFEGFELYAANRQLRLQTSAWSDSVLSNAMVVPSPEGAGNALVQTHQLGRDLLAFTNAVRVQFTGLPTRGQVGQPATVSARIRFNPAGAGMTRVFRLRNTTQSLPSNERTDVATIIFGAVDPTGAQGGSDGMVWVEQPNPAFDVDQEWQDHLVQAHWRSSDQWAEPPADAPLNTRQILIPTGVAHPIDDFFEVRAEVEPDAASGSAPPMLRLFIDETELFPNGDPSLRFVAGDASIARLEIRSAAREQDNVDSLLIDDVRHDSPLREIAPGPAFELPYDDAFTLYPARESIDEQGHTPFLSHLSVPDGQPADDRRMLTVLVDPARTPREGELVCRYMVDEVFLDAGLVVPGDIVAISHDDLPEPFNTFHASNLGCPGSRNVGRPFVIREAPNQPRLETGLWTLIDNDPVPYSPGNVDRVGFRYDYFTEPRWSAMDLDTAVTIRTAQEALGLEGDTTDQVLEIQVRSHDPDGPLDPPGSLNAFPMFTALTSILLAAEAAPEMNFANPERRAALAFDLYIESLDERGAPDDSLPPRSRFSVPLMGVGADGGRITTIMFGGPHVNQNLVDHLFNPPIGVLPPDAISVAVPSGVSPDVMFQPTGVSLLTGGAGIDGSIAGPLVNRWVRVIAEVNADSEWTIAIDEDRDGPLSPVTIASGVALDQGESGFDGLHVNLGRDIGSARQPVERTARVVTLPGEEAAIAPPNADPIEDYCFYEIGASLSDVSEDAPLIASPDHQSMGEVTSIRPIQEDDILAVLNRRVDGSGQVAGEKIHERCPWDIASDVNQFAILDGSTGEVRYTARWSLLGRLGVENLSSPPPAGGIAHIDGPVQNPPITYNDPALGPPDYPAIPEAKPILLATWADDEHDGWDPMPPVFPAQRWLIDNVRLEEIESAPPCPDLGGDPGVVDGADLAQLLANWGKVEGPNAADLNGDGVINGADLAALLANWGPCAGG